jgi:winged helix DNA-binding protein
MTEARLDLTRSEILAFRRRVGSLDARLPPGTASLRSAAWAGLSDSVPRGALLSIHARVDGTEPGTWEDPSLIQVWGPRFSAYVVAAEDRAVFTLGRMPESGPRVRRGNGMADRLEALLGGRRMAYGEAGRALGVNPNELRYGAPTGRILIRWDGARQPVVWTVPAPDMGANEARLELARRYLHVFGPGTARGFGDWAGIKAPRAEATIDALAPLLTPVRTPIGDGWILPEDEATFRDPGLPPAPARLLPSGDTIFLLQGVDRELLVPDERGRARLWPTRVWPGAVLVEGEVLGTWRRADAKVTVEPWRRFTPAERAAVEAEAASMPLPGVVGQVRVEWAAGEG